MGCLCAKSKCTDIESDEDVIAGLVDDHEPSINYGTLANVTAEGAIMGNCCQPPGRYVDICGFKSHSKFIIQSGTHCIEVQSLQDKLLVHSIETLREICKYGDHYLAQYYHEVDNDIPSSDSLSRNYRPIETYVWNFFIIKGASCVKVKNLTCSGYQKYVESTDKPKIFDLHPECQQGSFYLASYGLIYIIRNQDNTYLIVEDMSKEGYQPETASHHKLHETFTNGLCYFATNNYFYVVKMHTEFGLIYHRTKDLRSDAGAEMLHVSPSIVSIFLHHSILQDRQTNKGRNASHNAV